VLPVLFELGMDLDMGTELAEQLEDACRVQVRPPGLELIDVPPGAAECLRELLPADDASYGFDNIAGVLNVSPLLLERYLAAADRISRVAVGIPPPIMAIDYFRVPDDRSQEHRLPGMPFGTRGGTSIRHTFPVDGEYMIAAELQRDLNESVPLYAEAQHLEISIDGERVAVVGTRASLLYT
jgi:hypothetical protein